MFDGTPLFEAMFVRYLYLLTISVYIWYEFSMSKWIHRGSPLVWGAILFALPALAMETDQFTVPKAPLYDLGPQLSRKIIGIIEGDESGHAPAQILVDWIGHNIFASNIVSWVAHVQAPEGKVRFGPSVLKSIYSLVVFSPVPGSFFFNSPTVNAFGTYLGTDKIDHFFQQGGEYYGIVQKKRAAGAAEAEAIAAAIAHGVTQEHFLYGTMISGVYSNGDLAADYAGMKFYLNLLETVQIGDTSYPPLFRVTADGWRLRADVDPERMLMPYFSDHFNESLNPSRYKFSRGFLRHQVRKRCKKWKAFYADKLDLVAPVTESFARNWHGEEYGHWLPPQQEVSIATECTNAKDSVGKRTRN